jgi:outer membrane receptor protein involved in Fe transport
MYKNIPPCTSNGPGGAPGSPVVGLPGNAGCLSNVGTFPNTTVQNPGVQGDNTSFYQDQVRDTKQTAFFASFDYDLIPKVLTVTAGTRHFRFENSMKGSVLSSFGCYQGGVPPGGCLGLVGSYSFNLDNPLGGGPLQDTESGWKSRANLTWHIVPDVMVYYTFSQGFRPGGFNQNGGSLKALDPAFPPPNTQAQLILPSSYHSDDLTNNEIGWKTEFLDHRLQWNGAIYRETWNNVQVAFFDTGVTGNIFFDTNGQDFLIKGIETSVVARLLPGLALQAAGSWNYSRFQTNSPLLIDNNPGTANFGKQITNACTPLFICSPVLNPYGAKGSPSANTPPLQFSLRARYDWKLAGGYEPFVQVGASHSAHSFTQAGANPTFSPGGAVTTSRGRFENPAYSTYDASFGVAKDNWIVTAYGENLSNSNASVFVSTDQFIVAQTPLRPRVLGLALDYRF